LPEGISTGIAIVILLSLIVGPFINWFFLMRNRKRLNSHAFKDKFEAAYENVRTIDSVALGYTSMFMARRLLFASIVMLVENHRYIQTFLVLHLLLLGAAYTMMAKPFKDPVSNSQESWNDFITFQLSYCLIVFSDYVPDKKIQY
jgi:hypothetical protein